MNSIRLTSKLVCIALILVLLPCVAPRLRHPLPSLKPVDFNVYYAAGLLVRDGQASQIYKGADTGVDPQKVPAPLGSPLEVAARSQGITNVDMYLYPPLLADMVVPLTHQKVDFATHLWLALNVLLLLGTAASLVVLLDLEWFSLGALLLMVGAFSFTPIVDCFSYGQVTILLLFLWSLGTTLYAKGYTALSGMIFALAAAIKLTPALVVIPFIVWRNWRWLWAFTVSLMGLGAVCAYVNTLTAMNVYFHRVAPAMSRSAPELSNMSISAGTQLMIWALQGNRVIPDPISMPPAIVLVGKIVSTSLLLAFMIVVARLGRNLTMAKKVVIISLLALLSPVVSPVSWLHAYAIAFITFAVLWKQATRRVGNVQIGLLIVSSLMIGTYTWAGLMLRVHESVPNAAAHLLVLLVAAALVISSLAEMRGKQPNL